MIMCPNFSNPEVAREFEELKNATSEAAAYHIWSLNNGNAIDKAPNGAWSRLFDDLLLHYKEDRVKAIQAKAKVYGNNFLNWFGDWINDKENSSKVVDENGEPLVMYHFSKAKFDTFSYDYVEHEESGFFFSSDRNYAAQYGSEEYGAFLNVRNPMITDIPLHRENLYKIYNESFEKGNKTGDGVIGNDLLDDNLVPSEGWECMVFRSNQIKSIDNEGPTPWEGTYSRENDNIYDMTNPEHVLNLRDYLKSLRDTLNCK